MSYKPQLIVSCITILMVVVMGYAFEQNLFALNIDPTDNLPMIVQAYCLDNAIPVMT